MKTKTNVNAGALVPNHNQTLANGLRVRTSLNVGAVAPEV